MGENDTAAFDPIFYFHHCFIDLVFWRWQQLHDATTSFDIDPTKKGTDTSEQGDWSQGPAAGQKWGEKLTMDTPLKPFLKNELLGRYFTTRDVINIEDLGYTYGPSSISSYMPPA